MINVTFLPPVVRKTVLPRTTTKLHGHPQLFGVWRLAFADVLRTRGVSGLYAGLPVMVARSFPAQGSLFLGYETARSALG